MKATVFLGGGRITGALLAGLRLSGYKLPLLVHDRNASKLRALGREFQVEAMLDLKSAVERAGMLIVAVRPDSVADLLAEVARCGAARRPMMAVSLVAGIPLRKLRTFLGFPVCWARAMPSPVSRVGRGLTGVAFDGKCSKADRRRVRGFFQHVGPVLEIPEAQFDAFTATYSSSHGYHALATLAKAARAKGLTREIALTAAAHALADGISYWREIGLELSELLHEAVTPGGIAAATLKAMDKSGYEEVVTRGLRAGIQQARANSRR
ncbi:MAG: pyrroline-5-carboxylate reductase dimerization domain-containing protein [Candidatus Sulfotelmatobacter sp.]